MDQDENAKYRYVNLKLLCSVMLCVGLDIDKIIYKL